MQPQPEPNHPLAQHVRHPLRIVALLESDDKVVAVVPPVQPRLEGAASPRARTTRPVCDAGTGCPGMAQIVLAVTAELRRAPVDLHTRLWSCIGLLSELGSCSRTVLSSGDRMH